MKKINIVRSWLIGSFVLFGITSCTAGFEDANRPGHETSLEELGRDDYAVSSFITELQNFAFPEQENTYQNTEDLIGNYLGRYMTYVGLDAAIFMHPTVWKASGHVDAFNDPLIDNRDSKAEEK